MIADEIVYYNQVGYEGLSLDFGLEYIYSFDQENKVLSIKKNSHYIPFFYNENDSKVVQNVSLIVGANGAGKTFLLNQLAFLNSSNTAYGYIIIFKRRIQNEIEYYIFNTSQIDEIAFESSITTIEKKNFKYFEPEEEELNKILLENTPDVVYLSNVFDLSHSNGATKNFYYDLTTNGLLKKASNNNSSEYGNINLFNNSNIIDQLNQANTSSIIDFISSTNIKELDASKLFYLNDRRISLNFFTTIDDFFVNVLYYLHMELLNNIQAFERNSKELSEKEKNQ
ncbi:hypothetical protein [Myroides odoratimimus]|uniref:hypothetical protein n=1 Tax=Myroides odoratimimus TaxID=76832 RepID=UPI002578D218|nr:hypothetical protein [Myroides odoratimimus]MDM1465315.1 hypothetical protein [Myroides odoratimimus]MDM1475319.1 hypothetical protein [Myroides odoratimimus]